jgi:hypothetical protein
MDTINFTGELMDDGVDRAVSANVKSRKPGISKGTTIMQAFIHQQAKGATFIEE